MKTCIHGIRPKRQCTLCRKLDERARRDANPVYREKQAAYREAHREELRARGRRDMALRRAQDPDKVRLQAKLAYHKLDKTEYDIMLRKHDGKCGMCGKKAKLFIDHNHNTGQVRGLICNRCNVAVD